MNLLPTKLGMVHRKVTNKWNITQCTPAGFTYHHEEEGALVAAVQLEHKRDVGLDRRLRLERIVASDKAGHLAEQGNQFSHSS